MTVKSGHGRNRNLITSMQENIRSPTEKEFAQVSKKIWVNCKQTERQMEEFN